MNDARNEIPERYREDMERERVSPAYEQDRGSPAYDQERVSSPYARSERFTDAYDGTLAVAKSATASLYGAHVQEMFGMRRGDQCELPLEIEKRRVDESTKAVMPAGMQFSGFQSNQNVLEGALSCRSFRNFPGLQIITHFR